MSTFQNYATFISIFIKIGGDRANALNILTAYDAFDISTLDAEGREVTARF